MHEYIGLHSLLPNRELPNSLLHIPKAFLQMSPSNVDVASIKPIVIDGDGRGGRNASRGCENRRRRIYPIVDLMMPARGNENRFSATLEHAETLGFGERQSYTAGNIRS